jgi:hypothetical protein
LNQDLKEIADKENTSVESLIKTALYEYCSLALFGVVSSVAKKSVVINHAGWLVYLKKMVSLIIQGRSQKSNSVVHIIVELDEYLAENLQRVAAIKKVDRERVFKLALHRWAQMHLERGEA